ncbi:MAG: tetratricopeptide repeat protein [Deltaproteobacteria bacterium]|nr:tetratricopeptide repeat protein [Deltaproteobacteria bacterium]
MMIERIMKYNPAFLTDDELLDTFVVRQTDLKLLTQVLYENTTQSNQHLLVIGPRGIGKTTLVLRVVAEVRLTRALNERWFPLVFGEESYQVTTPGEFWLETIFHLGQQTGDFRWKQTYDELHAERDEDRLRERALAQLLDFADTQGKRVLLVVENLNTLLGAQIDSDAAWKLRHTLLNEPRVMLLASATSRFEMVESTDQAFFEAFKLHDLEPLSSEECRTVWTSVTGKSVSKNRIRPIEILTGGNPRLLTIVASFGAHLSLRELMSDLTKLVDDHTEYFKSHLDALATTERKVYLALAELWSPSTTREVAQAARLEVNKTSALLKRLTNRGAVVVVGPKKSKKLLYRVAERMYNVYYLMRRRGSPSNRVRAAVKFMIGLYGQEGITDITYRIARESFELKPADRNEHYLAYDAIVKQIEKLSLRQGIIKATPDEFFKQPDTPEDIKKLKEQYSPEPKHQPEQDVEIYQTKAIDLLGKAIDLIGQPDKLEERENLLRKALEAAPNLDLAWIWALFVLEPQKRYIEAEDVYRKAIELNPEEYFAIVRLVALLLKELNRPDEALTLAEDAIARCSRDPEWLNGLAWVFYTSGRTAFLSTAEKWALEATEKEPEIMNIQHTLACIYIAQGKKEEALTLTERYLESRNFTERQIKEIIDLTFRLAAAGEARMVLDLINDSPSAELLEPLIVGLQLFLGDKFRAPLEIVEVGKDVAARITERSHRMGKDNTE